MLVGSILARLSGVEVVQVDEVTRTPGSPLHRPQVLKRAYRDRKNPSSRIDRLGSKLRVGQDTLDTLDHPRPSSLVEGSKRYAVRPQATYLGDGEGGKALEISVALDPTAPRGAIWTKG